MNESALGFEYRLYLGIGNSLHYFLNLEMEEKTDLTLTNKIIGAAIEVHRVLGPGLLETVYEQALCQEFELRAIKFERQKRVDFLYKQRIIKGQVIDILVGEKVVVELKAVSQLPDVAVSQTLSYLKATGLQRALLINFGMPRLVDGVKRISL